MTMKLRGLTPEDTPFLFSTWLRCYRQSPAVRSVPNSIYYAEHHEIIEAILASSCSQVIVACDPENDNTIYGYIVVEHQEDRMVVHWIYVKRNLQKNGIGRKLLEAASGNREDPNSPVVFTHYTKDGARLNRERKAIYNPYELYQR